MRVKQITVKGLFGSFDHTISLNMEDRITILHGLNGVGKTTLFSMFDAFFNGRFNEIFYVKFNEFLMNFDSDEYIQIQSKTNQESSLKNGILWRSRRIALFDKENNLIHEHSLSDLKNVEKVSSSENEENPERGISLSELSQRHKRLLRESTLVLLNTMEPRQSHISEEAQRLLGDIEKTSNTKDRIPDWLNNLTKTVNVKFVQYQRLLLEEIDDRSNNPSDNSKNKYKNTVEIYSQNLAKSIRDKLTEYGGVSNRLDRSFPSRVLQKSHSQDLSEESLRNRVQELEEQRERLVLNGLLKSEEDTPFQPKLNESMDDGTKRVLSVYLEDVDQKLGIFDDIYEKVNLFKEIIDQNFLRKKVAVDPERGLIFYTDTGQELTPTDLSSGEQHEIVMLYELLFNLKPDSLVLIDEPELSLHMGWKVRFLKDLVRIVELSKIDIVLATHSASLIKDRWDLTVELKG